MSKIKRLISLFIVAVVISSFCCYYCSAAAVDGTVAPLYDNVTRTYIEIDKNSGKIEMFIMLSASSGTTYEGGILTLKKTVGNNSVFLENLRNLSSTTASYSYYNDVHDAESGTYTVKFAIYAVRNGVRERINLEKTLVV